MEKIANTLRGMRTTSPAARTKGIIGHAYHGRLASSDSTGFFISPNDWHQRQEPAANDVEIAAERNGWLLSAACCG
jgi:hypothetical protein